MANAKETLIGVGIAQILFYFLVITIVKSMDEVLFDIVMDFGILIIGIITLIFGFTMSDD